MGLKRESYSVWGLRPLVGAVVGCYGMWPSLVSAQEVNKLGAITVTASGYEQDSVVAPATITVISREDLEHKRFSSLADAVRDVPGVSLVGGDKGEISIRGMESSQVLILVDGRRQSMRELALKGGVAEALGTNWIPPLDAIERIEVVRGPMSTLYGSEAMGGVINIITRKVANTWSGSLSTDYVWQDSGKAGDSSGVDAYVSGPLVADVLGVQVWGYDKRRKEDRVLDGFAKAKRQNGNVRFWLTPHKDHDVLLEAGRETQQFWNTPGHTRALTAAENENKYVRDHYTVAHQGRWDWGDSDLSFYEEKAYRDGPTQSARPDVKNQVFEAKANLPLGQHMLLAGVQWKRNSLKTDAYYASPTGLGVNTSLTEKSAFIEDEWAISPRFSLTGGLRLDDNDYYGRHWTPRLYGVWTGIENWTFKGGVAKGFKSPSIVQSSPDIGLPQRGGAKTWGNPDLQPEKSVNSEIGAYFDNGGPFSANVTVFHIDYSNKIANTGSNQLFYPDGSPVPPDPFTNSVYSTYFNITKARIQGLEMAAAYDWNDDWRLSGTYTYTDSKVKDGETRILGFGYPQADGQPLVATPKHMGSATLHWRQHADLSAFATMNYRGKEINIAWGQGGRVNESLGSITTVDLGLSWRISKAVDVSAVVYNVADRTRSDSSGGAYAYAEDGRRVWAKLNYRF